MATAHLVIDGSRHPATLHFGPLFDFDHLPASLQAVSEPFTVCARAVIDAVPDGPELSAALRKLVEAKDCAVRARVLADRPVPQEAASTRSLPIDERLTAISREAAAGDGTG